ncbi:hypothetical protein COCNU_scaffold002197G000010 [Cocos nucifera]|nr:hypothetical protein [Cocos nucifera]
MEEHTKKHYFGGRQAPPFFLQDLAAVGDWPSISSLAAANQCTEVGFDEMVVDQACKGGSMGSPVVLTGRTAKIRRGDGSDSIPFFFFDGKVVGHRQLRLRWWHPSSGPTKSTVMAGGTRVQACMQRSAGLRHMDPPMEHLDPVVVCRFEPMVVAYERPIVDMPRFGGGHTGGGWSAGIHGGRRFVVWFDFGWDED